MTKPKLHRVFLLVWLACFTVRAAETEEAKLIAVLRSAQPAAAKDAACRRLKHIGTSAAVPALAPLLLDEALSHSARYALESIPGPEVDAALRDALGRAKGAARIGIVDSLGDRGDLQAAPALISLLTDPQMGEPAARALGKIGGPDAAKALQAALPKDSGPLRNAVLDALLRCADGLRARDAKAARSVYGALHGHTTPVHVRLAAFRGAALASDDLAAGAVRLLEAKERAPQLAGLQLVREIEGEDATKAFATALAKVDPTMQIPLLHALRQRGDRAAGSAVGSLATKGADPIRIVALRALAVLGDASTVPLLAERAAAAKGAEQDAARLALARLRGEGVGKAILAALAKADPRAQGELATALGRRRESEAVPALLKMAGGADSASRLAAARSLALLADESTAPKLIPLLVSAKTDAERAAFERALASTCGGMGDPQGLVAPAIAAMNGASVPARGALLRVLARVGGDAADGALRTSVKDGNAAIRDAAVRAMAEFGDSGLAPDLLALAKQAPTPALGVLALRGYWRLVGEADAGARLALCEAGLAASARPEEKKLGLTALATVSHPKALALAESLAKDPAVRAEAEAACVEIAASLVG
ncbi:HEAT repeat domain-containing protein, partial [bacterium]|nr:HEAT repeat domain-containing protein [bacterium]